MDGSKRRLGLLAPLLAVASASAAAEMWSPNPCVAVFEGEAPAAGAGADCAIQIAGARNGSFSGQVVVRAGKGPEATISDLKQKDGDGIIPASAIRVRYALPTGGERGRKGARFDALASAPRAEGALHPVWVTASVPEDAAPGEYEGRLSVAGREVKVSLAVAGWTLPAARDFRTHVGVYQSPESVALQYKVDLWSERHFELVGKSFDQLARAGNKVINIPLIAQTNFGNSQSMVRWIRDGEGFRHDFSIAERYLDLYIERVGKPRVVILYIYEPRLGGSHGRKKEEWERGVRVTLLDPATKKIDIFEGPPLNNGSPGFPKYPDDMKAFWKPVLDGLRERLKARGIGDEAIVLGMNGDDRVGGPTTEHLQAVAPYACWTRQGHGYCTRVNSMKVGYLTYVWGAGPPPDPAAQRVHGWRNPFQACVFPRYGGNPWVISPPLWDSAPLGVWRSMGEACITGKGQGKGIRGFGRTGADFWPVLGEGQRTRSLVNRYPLSNRGQLSLTNAATQMLAPGPEGAVPTVRFEMLLEGLQECEARIFLEGALLDEASRAKLGDALAKKVQEILDERVRVLRETYVTPKDRNQKRWDWWSAESGWQKRSAKLYAAAAEAAKALGGG